jgi:hypothetical protein
MSTTHTTWQGKVEHSNKQDRAHTTKKYKGVGSIGAIEPYTPPVVRDEVLAPPLKQGESEMSISPEPKAGPGWREAVKNAPADPKDVKRLTQSDIVKT